MLLQDLPAKTFHRLLKSVTWTEVDALPTKNPLRRFASRIAQPGSWAVRVQLGSYITNGRKIDRLLRIRRALGRLLGRF